ncbi:SEC-C metal-binding domain-containing protein [Neobacillus soli]|uniref:SEC-C metal-binding domain-containing protein n=1 Tax=Neobacillus soli TaxID=220688 RepID=UPI0008270EDC|nr:SEC-C metal-binding domain-containing protein [Neobacillus soli]
MDKINRNAPCPCGSGKKYKMCCGVNEAISITHMVESEVDELQKHILHFSAYHFGQEIQDDFEDIEEIIDIDNEQEREFYELIHAIWFSLFEELDDGETIIKKFIAAELGKIKRPKLRKILQTWTDARTIAGKVIAIENNKITVEDGFSSEQLDAVITNVPVTIEPGSFFVGIIVPFEQKYVFFPSPFDLPDLKPEHAFSYIEDSSLDANYDSPQEYFTDFFIEVLSELPLIEGLLEIDEMEWPAPIYKEVADLFKKKLETLLPPPIVDTGIILWLNFCQKRQKRIKNPNLYVAALHYLLSTIAPIEKIYTQKELARLYGVSTGSVSSIFLEMETVLSQEIAELVGLVSGMDESPLVPPTKKTPVIEFPRNRGQVAVETTTKEDSPASTLRQLISEDVSNKKKKSPVVSRHDEERARNLIYDAFQSEGKHRYNLAEEALRLNPNCVDAYVLLAERTKTLEEAILLYEKGIQVGERELGKAFLKENKGYFWGLIETRPFMRAKLHYAEALSQLGKVNESLQQYEELLELNPMDNQGVRYSLFVAYIDSGEFKKAGNLLQQYEEASAQGLYNKLLLELHEKGFTKNAVKLLKAAKKENKHVVAYLTDEKRLPDYPPDYYGFGDENEAIVYADMHLRLWRKIDGVREWLKSVK